MNFDQATDILLSDRVEGGYSNNPYDAGGETMWGITRKTALRHGYEGDMRLLPKEKAKEIYRSDYWDVNHIDSLPDILRYSVFDAGVNSGPPQAATWLQRALGIAEDGIVGPMTVDAANKSVPLRVAVMLETIRLDSDTTLATWGHFSRGWARRSVLNIQRILTERIV